MAVGREMDGEGRQHVTAPTGEYRSTPSSAPRARPPVRRTTLLALGIALLALLPYGNALDGEFVFDDIGVIRDNPMIHRDPPLRLFVTPYEPGALYRPLTMLTYVANARLDPGPAGFHAVNIALHVAVSLAVYALALQLLVSPLAAGAAAALFAVHPIHTEAVTGIVGRAELLAALASLCALLAVARALAANGGRRAAWIAVSLLAFAAGLLAKESAFATIGLVAVLFWWRAPDRGGAAPASAQRAPVGQRLHAGLRLLLPYLAVGIAYLALRLVLVGSLGLREPPEALDNPLAHVDAATRWRTALVVLWDYLALLVAPLRLSADYSFAQEPLRQTWSDPRVLAALLLLGGLAAGALAAARRAPQLTLAATLWAVPLALTANLLFPIGTIKAERLLYLPSLGVCVAAGWLLARWHTRRPRGAAAALGIVLALFAARTWVRNADWQSERTLYAAAVAVAPDSAKAHHNYAVTLQRDGELEAALSHFARALALYPAYASAAFGIGHVHALRGDEATALHWYNEALRRDDRLARAHLQIGLLHQRRGAAAAAEAAFAAGLRGAPGDPLLLVNLAAARLAQGDARGARRALARLDRSMLPADPRIGAVVAAARREIEVAMR